MTLARTRRGMVSMMALIVAGSLAMSGCAPTGSTPTSKPTVTASTEPAAYAGPLMFIGDEIDAFLLDDGTIEELLPVAGDISDPIDGTFMYSDGGGPGFDPPECIALLFEQQAGAVGARTVEWEIDVARDERTGTMRALQYGSIAQAEERMDQVLVAAEKCSTFTWGGAGAFSAVAESDRDGVRAVAGVLAIHGDVEWRNSQAFSAYAQVGNVLVQVTNQFSGENTISSEDVVSALLNRADEARSMLVEKLTAAPPTEAPAEEAASDSPVADWSITFGGVGPIALGEDTQAAAAEVVGGEVSEGPLGDYSYTIALPDNAGSLQLRPDDSGGVALIEVGAPHFLSPQQDGSGLPNADGVRVGAPMSEAMAAFPEGSLVRVNSAAMDHYMMADRSGRVILFSAEKSDDPESARIYSITVEDRSTWAFELL